MSILMAVFLSSLVVSLVAWGTAWLMVQYDPMAYQVSLRFGGFDRFAMAGLVFWLGLATAIVGALGLIWRAAL